MKLKKYALHWEATVSGVQYVDAFDEQDAQDQFDTTKYDSDLEDVPIYAVLMEVELSKEPKKALRKGGR